ncbi:MAG: hypothetical protein IJD91_09315 [Clostridia bacterium]|nr:hypothetical protein [Clostridia bacterium]
MKVTQLPTTSKSIRPQKGVISLPPQSRGGFDIAKILSRFETDDYILAGIILVLVFEGCDDYILLAALGYLFIMGLKE